MRLRSLVPSRESGALTMRPSFPLFGLHREIDRLFSEFAQGIGPEGGQANIIPNIEVSETDNVIEITAEMPGLERNDIDISIEDDTLTIRGEKRVEERQEERNVQLSERTYGVFLRVLQLPPGIDPSNVQATMSNGILRIVIPKPAKPEAKKIEVKEGQASQGQAKEGQTKEGQAKEGKAA
jgi:HSP20 family protein